MELRDELELIRRIIREELRYCKTYLGKVVDVDDEDKKGAIKCKIYELGMIEDETAIWVSASDRNSMIVPKKDDFVRISFMNGDSTRPYWFAIANEMKDMISKDFDGKAKTNVLYEDNESKIKIIYDTEDKKLTLEDGNNNKVTINSDGIKLEDGNNNTIVMKSGEVDITGTNFKMLGATESYVKGTTFNTWMTTFISLLNSHTHTGVQAGGSSTGTPASAFTAPSNWISTKITGE